MLKHVKNGWLDWKQLRLVYVKFHLWEISYKCVVVLCFGVLSRDFLNYSWTTGRVLRVYMTGGSLMEVHNADPKKYTSLEF